MKKSKRKSWIIWNLAKESDKSQRKSNRIYIVAVAFTVLLLFSTFSIAKGKIETDQLRNMRKANTASNVSFSNATRVQYQKIKELEFVEHVGIEKSFAGIYGSDNQMLFSCVTLDSNGYKKMLRPACTETVGNYPQKNNEIFMSKRALKALGIDKPEIGMKIALNIEWFDWMTNKEHANTDNRASYILSGYNTSYEDITQKAQVIYFSQEFLKEHKIALFPGKLLIKTKYDFLEPSYIEKLLYQNIELENESQQFMVENSSSYQAMTEFAGGFKLVFACAIILCVSAYLLIYNLVSISLNQNIRQYGLLETIGMTRKQIRNMIYLQSLRKSIVGSVIGGIISAFINVFLIQTILQKLYLNGLGTIHKTNIFRPVILFFSIAFVFGISLFSCKRALKKLKILNPLEAGNYYGSDLAKESKRTKARKWKKQTEHQIKKAKKKSCKITRNGSEISHMAWRNMKREKAKLTVSLLSLLLGCEVILGFCVLENGTDTMNKIRQNYDFEIGIDENMVNKYLDTVKFENEKQKKLFSDEKLNELAVIANVTRKDIKISQGGYGFIETDKKDAFEPRNQSLVEVQNGNNFVTFQIIQNRDLKKLENYKLEKSEDMDLEALKSGKGALLLHENELSVALKKAAKKVLDKSFTIYPSYVSMAENKENTDILCSGYLDTTQKSFPDLDYTYHGDGINYLLVTENGFKKLGLTKQIFHISFNVQQDKESLVKEKLKQWVVAQNSGNSLHFYIVANSDKIVAENSYIQASRLIMTVLGSFLLVMGILNYLNTRSTDLVTRQNEFILLETIGMTRKQLQKMILLEGIYFCALLWSVVISVGSFGLWIFGRLISENISYFRFYYPIDSLMIMVFSFSIICILLPQIYFRKMT